MRKIKLEEIVWDDKLYPRQEVDSLHVAQMVKALAAGVKLPPIVIEKVGKPPRRGSDGKHRWTAHKIAKLEEIEVVEKSYACDADLFLDAVRLNAGHGRPLTGFERAQCAARATQLRLEAAVIASAMMITCEELARLIPGTPGRLAPIRRFATYRDEPVILKHSIDHKGGESLTEPQMEANRKLGGMKPVFYVNQVILLLENDLLNRNDAALMRRIDRLGELIEGINAVK